MGDLQSPALPLGYGAALCVERNLVLARVVLKSKLARSAEWWRLGLVVSFATITIRTVAGLGWRKFLGW